MTDSLTEPAHAVTAVIFVCDQSFIVPTVGAALSARRQTSDPTVRVIVYVTDMDAALVVKAHNLAEVHGVSVRASPILELTQLSADSFAPTHASITMLGRLWLDDLLEPEIMRFLYLDGDVDITGSLDPLLAMSIPRGGFLAAPDRPWLLDGESGHIAGWNKDYLKGLGITRAADYFNSGVLLVDRAGWGDLSRAAREFLFKHPERCRWPDQSALNAVAGAARGMLSPIWNYNTDFMAVVDPRRWGYEPVIWHFTGVPKPWHGSAYPWGNAFGGSFKLGSELLEQAGFSTPALSESSFAACARSRKKGRLRLKWVYPWRRLARAKKIRAALAASYI
jgi:lipopolysaccharide biosynthesis glycosyltransferase